MYLENEQGTLFLQQRSRKKKIWDIAVQQFAYIIHTLLAGRCHLITIVAIRRQDAVACQIPPLSWCTSESLSLPLSTNLHVSGELQLCGTKLTERKDLNPLSMDEFLDNSFICFPLSKILYFTLLILIFLPRRKMCILTWMRWTTRISKWRYIHNFL